MAANLPAPGQRRVILSVFAGRESCMTALNAYVARLMQMGLVHDYHAWNFAKQPSDEAWLRRTFPEVPQERVGMPGEPRTCLVPVADRKKWGEYYQHYTKERYPNSIVIKCDDDIVFIDTRRFADFIRTRAQRKDVLFMFPTIINNEICAWYQQLAGLLPEERVGRMRYHPVGFGSLWDDGHKTQRLHDFFLSDPDGFCDRAASLPADARVQLMKINDRISVNFFAVLSEDLDAYQMVGWDDEKDLSQVIPGRVAKPIGIDSGLTVAHLAFFRQRETGLDVDRALRDYVSLLNRHLAKPAA